MWVSLSYSNSVQLITTSGCNVGSPVPTGIFPLSLVFDGANMRDRNGRPLRVSRLQASEVSLAGGIDLGMQFAYEYRHSGARVRPCDFGDVPDRSPRDIAYDGAYIWVASSGANTLTHFNPAMVIPSSFLPSRILGLLN
jgi:hypothetical protein